VLSLEDVSVAYGPILAVRSLSMEVGEGQIVALLGRNGAGKTTTLNGILGLNRAHLGRISYRGIDITSRPTHEIARLGVSYVPEGRGIFHHLNAFENVATAAYAHGARRRPAVADINRVLGFFPSLEGRFNQRAGTMSGGEQQMLALARALVTRPSILLVDEPGLGLAPIVVAELYALFERLNREEGLSVLLVEQYVRLALGTARYAYVLEKGELAYETRCGHAEENAARLLSAYVG
jgi:branched-chain amino acid transport system ATP-binding protein